VKRVYRVHIAFTRPFNLKGHYNGHLNIKEFPCEHPGCGKVFRRKADRKRHQKSHEYYILTIVAKRIIFVKPAVNLLLEKMRWIDI
jgi:hypothetical protein